MGSIWWQGRIDAGYPNAGLEINWAWGPDSRLGACVVEKFSLSCAPIIREPSAETTPATFFNDVGDAGIFLTGKVRFSGQGGTCNVINKATTWTP